MSYKIIYDHQIKDGYHRKRCYPKLSRWIAGIILAAVILCMQIQPVRLKIKELILPDSWYVTETALDSMIHNIRRGTPIYDAVAVFCQEIIDDAKAG